MACVRACVRAVRVGAGAARTERLGGLGAAVLGEGRRDGRVHVRRAGAHLGVAAEQRLEEHQREEVG
eukprot:5536318-Pleurochrysis_carterae.AAC.1